MRWWCTVLLMSCTGGPIDLDGACDGLCVGTLDVNLATDSTTFGLSVVDGEMSLEVSCPEGTLSGVPPDADMSVTCRDGGVELMATSFDWPARATFGLAGESWELDLLVTDTEVCATVCTSAAVTLPDVR